MLKRCIKVKLIKHESLIFGTLLELKEDVLVKKIDW
nr:MAG TPA: hypothetical protein [Caudoviricetes sp.]